MIKNYPFFNYFLRSGTPNNFKHGKFGILLVIFLGIIRKFDGSLVRYFDAFLYQIFREIDFTTDGLTIPRMEVNTFKYFLSIYSDLTNNAAVKILGDNLCVMPWNGGDNSDAEAIIDDIDMLLCHVVVRYNVENILERLSAISRINIFEINKILLIRYFPRTFLLLKNFEAVPSEFLINSPRRVYYYMQSSKRIYDDSEVSRILKLELKIFETKFFLNKGYPDCYDLNALRDLINQKINHHRVRVNDTISILHDYYVSDVDLERWTGNASRKSDEMTDVIVYYDYISSRVRHQQLTEEITDILSFFRRGEKSIGKYLEARNNNLNAQCLLNELVFKGILIQCGL
jgi:hypothetical protein